MSSKQFVASTEPQVWQTTRFDIDLSRPVVMGIVNVTPDSFSDGGQHANAELAAAHCRRLLDEGADILDIGGESSRPGSVGLSLDEEWARIAPVLEVALTLGVPVSVDTCKAGVMARALDMGVDIINDIKALRDEAALPLLGSHAKAGVCLMHMRGESSTMQSMCDYVDVLAEVADFLRERADCALAAGIAASRIVMDPGYGFAKTTPQNFDLLSRQSELLKLGFPILAGWSRKRSLGDVTGRAVDQRLPASLAAGLVALSHGAKILRVHDVAATVDAVKVWCAAGGLPAIPSRC
ncbi:dihydropteroate synthase [Paucibacter sp. Y2R2-4]|uniref:dihydropteroate synthase n=1 Tax=Paucibacter sp. Y2R2-4 TaxID=2893553 RepID=UPI0021E47AF3|nr:dihydropteroate synthase [Paucibacter sp. Y2R2-4]MCV2348620.1 dihydropteroate synthase [Paucibacter sp. Y2R2-4]